MTRKPINMNAEKLAKLLNESKQKVTTALKDNSKLRELANSQVSSFDDNKAREELKQLAYNRLVAMRDIEEQLSFSHQKEKLQRLLLNMKIYSEKAKCVFDIHDNNKSEIRATFNEYGFMLDFLVNLEEKKVFIFGVDNENDSTLTIEHFLIFQSRFI